MRLLHRWRRPKFRPSRYVEPDVYRDRAIAQMLSTPKGRSARVSWIRGWLLDRATTEERANYAHWQEKLALANRKGNRDDQVYWAGQIGELAETLMRRRP